MTGVLIVDDALYTRTIIRDILEGSGRFRIVGEASTGAEAVARFREIKPDIVTMDLVMPGMSGIEACREILKEDPGATVVVCSALGQEAAVVEAITAGAADFIVKPFTPEQLLRTLSKAREAIA